jgi:antirestriction protein ArdC
MSTLEKKLSKAEETALDFITSKLADTKILPWAKPWTTNGNLPFNYFTNNTFSGLNLFICMFFNHSEFGTFKAISNAGGTVKKGSKSIPLLRPATSFFLDGKKLTYKQFKALPINKQKECKSFTYFVTYRVFNLETQTEGIEIKREKPKEFTPQLREDCDKLITVFSQDCPVNIIESNKAFYSPSSDQITLPLHKQFEKTEMFYSTAFHEMVHSTGHAKRLKRDGVVNMDRKGSQKYAKEELVAEIGASILNATYGTFDNTKHLNVAYVQNWLDALKNDPKMIIEASKDSKKAVDYILKSAI